MPPVPDTPPARLEIRRKILRAGLGVPAITAVASGSALAATSATCFARQLSAPIFPTVNDGNGDTYLRVQLGKLTASGGTVSYYVDGSAIAALAPRLVKSASYTLSSTQFRTFDVQANTEGTSSVNAVATGTYVKAGGKFAVLRFDTNGQIIGVGRSTTLAQSAVTDSCWSSAAP